MEINYIIKNTNKLGGKLLETALNYEMYPAVTTSEIVICYKELYTYVNEVYMLMNEYKFEIGESVILIFKNNVYDIVSLIATILNENVLIPVDSGIGNSKIYNYIALPELFTAV